ncbi:DUF883 family protein [Uliginosibacterium gangwonense]|uniref:DUF883 family protein n=1 Tax=Uliginosibacterium gangwonense TaxID=392736 RepID=UPI00036E3171|nr:DUF883 family protein [Uliginosibacterium gangwonense]
MSDLAESRDKLIADLKTVLADTDDLLKITADNASGKIAEAREKIKGRVDAVKARLAESEVAAVAKQAAKTTDAFVQENPWKSVGIAAGVGLVIGLLIGRR